MSGSNLIIDLSVTDTILHILSFCNIPTMIRLYSFDQTIRELLNDPSSIKYLCISHNLPSCDTIHQYVSKYDQKYLFSYCCDSQDRISRWQFYFKHHEFVEYSARLNDKIIIDIIKAKENRSDAEYIILGLAHGGYWSEIESLDQGFIAKCALLGAISGGHLEKAEEIFLAKCWEKHTCASNLLYQLMELAVQDPKLSLMPWIKNLYESSNYDVDDIPERLLDVCLTLDRADLIENIGNPQYPITEYIPTLIIEDILDEYRFELISIKIDVFRLLISRYPSILHTEDILEIIIDEGKYHMLQIVIDSVDDPTYLFNLATQPRNYSCKAKYWRWLIPTLEKYNYPIRIDWRRIIYKNSSNEILDIVKLFGQDTDQNDVMALLLDKNEFDRFLGHHNRIRAIIHWLNINPDYFDWKYENIVNMASDVASDNQSIEIVKICYERNSKNESWIKNSKNESWIKNSKNESWIKNSKNESWNFLNSLYYSIRYCRKGYTMELYQLLFPNPNTEYIKNELLNMYDKDSYKDDEGCKKLFKFCSSISI